MYRVCIPVNNKYYSEKERKSLIRELEKANADTVFLIFHRILNNESQLSEMLDLFVKNMNILKDSGFKVGMWLAPTIGYGSTHWGDNGAEKIFTSITSVDETSANGAFCPLDERFEAEFLKFMKALAKTGVKDILFEDDFNLGGGKGKAVLFSCCCDKHLKIYSKMMGEHFTADKIREKVMSGGKNKYRDAFLKLMGDTLCNFASKIEKAVHEVDSSIRIGLSANASSCISEGTTVFELAKIIAGSSKPFVRMTGAPYWQNAVTLGPNIDAIRVQESWCDGDVELLTEGDTYPRPRFWVPSAYLECYDMILRAEGKSHGILKYMIDYNYNADCETGYVDNHFRNFKHYEKLEELFKSKEPVGLNIFENKNLLEYENFSENDVEQYRDRDPLPLASQWFLSDNSIPTSYGVKGLASCVFGANAHFVTDEMLNDGVILDAEAAKILFEKGIDVGIRGIEKINNPMYENYITDEEYAPVILSENGIFYDFKTDGRIKILSEFIVKDSVGGFANVSPYDRSGKRIPACYLYENGKGQRFAVYSFVAKTVCVKSLWAPGLFRNYYRQKQIAESIEWLQKGKKLPAMCFKHPQLYILCKKNEESMTVGMWNIFADTVYTPETELDSEYKKAEFYNCDGKLCGDKIRLSTDIAPYSFAVITLYK
ncbi:MAG: hypothetical protein IJN39_03410 [Clostridia bacterium]|nr:hypothetical protein [Clostridia bacterium]